MWKQKSKNTLLAGLPRHALAYLTKDELCAMKYTMDHPPLPIYPLGERQPATYPDFSPWDEADGNNERLCNQNHLKKGYFEAPVVANEYYSARNLVQETVLLLSSNCTRLLHELAHNMTAAFRTRNDVLNKIAAALADFRLPPRVTMTAPKRDAWLRDLANPDVPLAHVCAKIPHGLRNRVLVDAMCALTVPLSRALWLTRCVLCSEQLVLRRRIAAKVSAARVPAATDLADARWVLEWTLHVADYVRRFARDMNAVASAEHKTQLLQKLAYLLSYVRALYVECLLDRTAFLAAAVSFLRHDQPFLLNDLPLLLELSRVDLDDAEVTRAFEARLRPLYYGQTLVGVSLIMTFWRDLLREDFLCKAAAEAMLLNYFLIERCSDSAPPCQPRANPATSNPSDPADLRASLLRLLADAIISLFRYNSNAFIVPDFWILVGDVLYRILSSADALADQRVIVDTALKLISYRNESLMLNMKYSIRCRLSGPGQTRPLRRNSFLLPALQSGNVDVSAPPIESDVTLFGSLRHDLLRLVDQLDRGKLNNFLAAALRPRRPAEKGYRLWKTALRAAVYWCVVTARAADRPQVCLLAFCNFLKRKVLHGVSGRGSAQLRAELENEVLESVFALAAEPDGTVHMHSLHVLINELYQLKVVSISVYIRKIIACGIFYESEVGAAPPQVRFHVSILQNLPVPNNKQCDHILRKWMMHGSNFAANFARGTDLARRHVLDAVVRNAADSYDAILAEIAALEVGVQFLVANWLTTSFKEAIARSPRLVHLLPQAVARLYRFYERTDNLTVFFKVLVRFVLKNEDRVIIFYLETLFFVCRLFVAHFSLVRLIGGHSHEPASAASELFKLVLLCYKDLLTRETDMYQFTEIWEFMARSMARPGDASAPPRVDRRFFFDKETADSPVNLHAHTQRRKDLYAPEDFHADLDRLIASDPRLLTPEEVADCFDETRLAPDTRREFASADALEDTVFALLVAWAALPAPAESVDLAFFKLVEHTRKRIRRTLGDQFYLAVSAFVVAQHQHQSDITRVAAFICKLVSYELFLIPDLLMMLENLPGNPGEEFWPGLVCELLFGCPKRGGLLASQTLMYEVLLEEYNQSHMEHLFAHAVREYKKLPQKRLEPHSYEEKSQLRAIMQNLVLNQRSALETLLRELLHDALVALCSQLLGEPKVLSHLRHIHTAARMPNEFSLPLWQMLLGALVAQDRPAKQDFGDVASAIVARARFLFGHSNSFFGELFDQVPWLYRVHVFYFFEDLFFDLAVFPPDKPTVPLPAFASGDMLAVLMDFFKKFSCPAAKRIEALLQLLQRIAQFLKRLSHVLELHGSENDAKNSATDPTAKDIDERLYNTVSIFLRLLIIHNTTLAEVAARSEHIDAQFFQSLMNILRSDYLSHGHEKLHILLYDLLLMIKSALTQSLAAVPNEPLLGTLHEAGPDAANLRRSFDPAAAAELAGILCALNLPEPAIAGAIAGAVADAIDAIDPGCIATLDDDELHRTSDICIVNNRHLELRAAGDAGTHNPFSAPCDRPQRVFTMKSVALIEDPTDGVNNGCLNLALFDAYTTRENPL
ncbi:hypothetical protein METBISCDRAFT_20754 [Metschnikowia bicuspidata]|uniref:Mediator of RNA polymerase II transcription subunit 12 n=1 Tax=Metschnikowia bicuspidata TaxID=27322 RepID=A0A4P9Z8R6_9ASCO|nr:hypothetical protein METBISCDRAFT_20754 [Metschnikowia bicuspidata]